MESVNIQMIILILTLNTFTASSSSVSSLVSSASSLSSPSSSVSSGSSPPSSASASSSSVTPLSSASSLSATILDSAASSSSSSSSSQSSSSYPGLTFEPHMESSNLTSYIEALHSVPDSVYDNAAIIAAMDSDEFHRDMYTSGLHHSATGPSPLSSSQSNTARIGELYDPEGEMYQEEFSPSLFEYTNSNINNQYGRKKPQQQQQQSYHYQQQQPTYAFHQSSSSPSSSGNHQPSLMDFSYNDLIPGLTRNNMGSTATTNTGINNNNVQSYNGVHLISNLVPKQNGYSEGQISRPAIKSPSTYNPSSSGSSGPSNPQDNKNLDIDINTIRGILFQVLKHLDSQELHKNINSAKSATTGTTGGHGGHGGSAQIQSHHHQPSSTYSQLQPSQAKKRTSTSTNHLYSPSVQPYSSSLSSSSDYNTKSSGGGNNNHPHHSRNNFGGGLVGNAAPKQLYMSHVPLAYTGKPSSSSASSYSPISLTSSTSNHGKNGGNSYSSTSSTGNNPGRNSKLPNHSVGYPTTVEIAGEQGLIAIPLPPNVVKFNYFGKNITPSNTNNIINTSNDGKQPKYHHHQHQPTGYFNAGSSIKPSTYTASSSTTTTTKSSGGKNCNHHHHHHHHQLDDGYAASS